MNEENVTDIQLSIDQAKQFENNGKSLENLQKNPEFQKLVIDGYFKQEAIRLVHLKSDHTQRDDESQKSIDQQIMAIGCFASYLNNLGMAAQQASEAIRQHEQELDYIYTNQEAVQ